MKNLLSDYEQNIFHFLDGLKVGTKCEVAKWSKEETRGNFISEIKKYIDLNGTVIFNEDYTRFKKIISWQEESKRWDNCTSEIYKQWLEEEKNRVVIIERPEEVQEDVWSKMKYKTKKK